MSLHRTNTARIGALTLAFIAVGCGGTFVRSFVNTQKEVDIKSDTYATPEKVVGGTAFVYMPPSGGASGPDAELLNTYAPILVQGLDPKAKYPEDSDQIGSPRIRKNETGGCSVRIEPDHPVLYASVEKTRVFGKELTQLVYVFWFPRHPVGMVEKGEIDGGVLRVTLDAGKRPAIFEYVMACGCWHGVFVEEHVEQWAEEEHPEKVSGKKWFVEAKVDNEDDWRVRDIVRGVGGMHRPIVFISAGEHRCVALQTDLLVQNLKQLSSKNYRLAEYAELERLPMDGGAQGETGSMFNQAGLVWGAERKGEEKLFSTMDHGGWPRRLNAMKIHWDEEAWNSDSLLEKFLRLPKKVTLETATPAPRH